MATWSKIDELQRRVAAKPIVEINVGPIKTLEAARDALSKINFTPDRVVVFGWEVLLSRRKQDGVVRWHLSTKLHPHGRPSTEDDWKIIGRIAARVGAPPDPVLMPEDPHAAVHWSWIET